MVGRHADQGGLVLLRPGEIHRIDDIGRQVPVAQQRDLGLARGAAGEQADGDVRLDGEGRCLLVVRVLAGGDEGAGGDLGDAFDIGDAVGHVVVDDRHRRRGAREQAGQLDVRQPIVHRRERLFHQGAGEEGGRQGRAVDADEGDGLGLHRLQPAGGALGAVEQLGEADAVLQAAKGDPVEQRLGRHFQEQGGMHRQSDDGSFLASFKVSGRPSIDSEPAPVLLQRASRPVSSST